MRVPLLLATLVAASLTLTVTASHCESWTTTDPEVTTPATGFSISEAFGHQPGGDGTYYVDNEICQIGCIFNVWIYEESNGIPGLQRGDEVVDDTCHGAIPGDSIVF